MTQVREGTLRPFNLRRSKDPAFWQVQIPRANETLRPHPRCGLGLVQISDAFRPPDSSSPVFQQQERSNCLASRRDGGFPYEPSLIIGDLVRRRS